MAYIYIVQDDPVQDETGNVLAAFTVKYLLKSWLQKYAAREGIRFAEHTKITRVRPIGFAVDQKIVKMLGKDILYESKR